MGGFRCCFVSLCGKVKSMIYKFITEVLIMKKLLMILILAVGLSSLAFAGEYLGQLTNNPYEPNSVTIDPYSPTDIGNHAGKYGNPYSDNSVTNPYAANPPKIYDDQGNYRGKLSSDPYDPDSVSNPYGRYGSPYSPDSINNPYGAGDPYSPDSPNNPYGHGLRVIGQ